MPMDPRNWEFLDKRLAELGTITDELRDVGLGQKIAFTAFFWTLIQYHDSDSEDMFKAGAMSLPDHLTPNNRQKIEDICQILDEWLAGQAPDSHPRYADLRRALDLGLQATTHPLFEPRRSGRV
jgi:hypothetical protein